MTTPDNKNIQKKFGSKLHQIRHNLKLSQEELALLCNLDRSYIGGVERGERNISLVNIHKIADALNISPKEFFDE
ncbi:helix-turn-helix transcriptional regulator [Anabaena aphanizomenioides LEGE 00250]|uniref:Helix-turn-helix transcriptional regulator n=1 Tax=Sphaerospermopsis aphanizomenoides LEGE 00250 TaxID=2777972 RepID=A0ABR9VK66_9CYAN|nr:helix-turn-helix transcriptional regulator [Sphaerospermopsis aphanizomenoides]MBE9238889.1 helix-turn-helix transcriptional regulator [Sphaerospermopsis aphanizomenoides LEGE 00250]